MKKKNNYIVKDKSIFDKNHKIFVILSEFLGIRCYYLKGFYIQKRPWWKRVYVFTLLTAIFLLPIIIINNLKLKTSFTSVIVEIMFLLLLVLSLLIVIISLIKNEFINDNYLLEITKNFDFVYEKLGKPLNYSNIKNISSLLQTFYFVFSSSLWGYNIYFNNNGINFYYFYAYLKIDFSFLSFITWLFVIISRIQLLNLELSKMIYNPNVNLLGSNVFCNMKCREVKKSNNTLNIRICNKVYLKLVDNLDNISNFFSTEVLQKYETS